MEVKRLLLACVLAAVTLRSAGVSPPGFMPGSVVSISSSDRRLQQVVLGAADSFNNQSNDAFLFRPASIHRAQTQIVKGIRFLVDFDVSRTVCRKRHNYNLTQCAFQPAGRLQQTLRCHVDVWVIVWRNQTKTRELHCGP